MHAELEADGPAIGRAGTGWDDGLPGWPALPPYPEDCEQTPGDGRQASSPLVARLRSRLWSVTETTSYYYVVAAAVIALSVADVTMRFLSACSFHDIPFDPECRQDADAIHWVGVAKYCVGVSPVLLGVLAKLLRVLRLQQQRLPAWLMAGLAWLPGVASPLPANHWNILATRSFFEESVQSVRALHTLVVLVQLPSIFFTAQQAVEGAMLFAEPYPSPNCHQGDGAYTSLQCQTRIWRFLAIQAAWTVCILPLNIFIVTPDAVWAPGVQTAAVRYGDISLQRLRLLPWILLFPVSLVTLNTFVFWCVLWDEVAVGLEHWFVLHFAVCVLCFALGVWLLLWSRVLHESFAVVAARSRGWARSRRASRLAAAKRAALSNCIPDDGDPELQPPTKHYTPPAKWDVTQHDFRRVIAVQTVYLFASYAGLSVPAIAIYTAFRVLVLALFFLGKERRSCFADLEASDPALGLVMEARALRVALTAMLHGKPWHGDIPTHRATVLRMQRTLAVSYKWHAEEWPLTTSDHTLNMSEFQIRVLIRSIRDTRCEFVWLDRLSVPQEPGRLQSALLSRMLIVYASAGTTLAIRARADEERLRYHRRAWTLQEFCCAHDLLVETEGRTRATGGGILQTGGALADCDAAVLPEEERFFAQLRARIQQSLRGCQPLWLCDLDSHITPARAKHVVALYQSLAPAVCCLDAGDKLRALVPLLAAIPVEGHKELLKLIARLKEMAGCEHLDEPGEALLRDRANSAWVRQSWLSYKRSRMSTDGDPSQGWSSVGRMLSSAIRNAPSRVIIRIFTSPSRVIPTDADAE